MILSHAADLEERIDGTDITVTRLLRSLLKMIFYEHVQINSKMALKREMLAGHDPHTAVTRVNKWSRAESKRNRN